MTEAPKGEDTNHRPSVPVLIFSVGLLTVILVNAYIIWYFLVGMPVECAARAVATAGRETCGAGPAVPVVLAVSTVLIAASIILLCRWHIRKKEA